MNDRRPSFGEVRVDIKGIKGEYFYLFFRLENIFAPL